MKFFHNNYIKIKTTQIYRKKIIIIMIQNKKILLFGGSGSLGNQVIKTYIHNNKITNYSRDECKHWNMNLKYKTESLKFIIGDIRDYNSVENAVLREDPDIIIIMAALKHIDRCEYAINECVQTNFIGPSNVLNVIEKNNDRIKNLECVVMISTDKACEATNVYGMAKALAESAIVEKSLHIKNRKFVSVRYGNVLNSRGSIIPILHEKGKDQEVKEFTLTHKDMTRFVMTLQQSVELIEYAILHGESGDTIIPKLISMKLIDLIEIFSEKYDKPIKITGLRPGEKMLESLISETQAMRLVKTDKGYMHIKPVYKNILITEDIQNYNSKLNPLNKEELYTFLNELFLL
jgi:UDP-glucose 4-epimerase